MGDQEAIALRCSFPGCDYSTAKQAPPFNLTQLSTHHKVAHAIDSGGCVYPMAMPLPGIWGNMWGHNVVSASSTSITSTIKEGARVEGGGEGGNGGKENTEQEKNQKERSCQKEK